MEPLVDIILATHNGAAYLDAQLTSLSAQTHRNWRLIAYDDGSTDDTPAILARFAAGDHRVLVLASNDAGDADGSGPVAAFSAALAQSDAPYFMFCDQDDVWMPDKTARLLSALAAAPAGAPALAHCDMQVVDADLNEIAPSFWACMDQDVPKASAKSLLQRNAVTGCAMMGNAALRDVMLPIPPEAMMHDWWAALLAAQLGVVVPVPAALVRYRRHGTNVTGFAPPASLLMGIAGLFAPGGLDVSRQRTHLAETQAQSRVLVPAVIAAGGTAPIAAEFGALSDASFFRRKTFLWRHGLMRLRDPLWTLAYHWII